MVTGKVVEEVCDETRDPGVTLTLLTSEEESRSATALQDERTIADAPISRLSSDSRPLGEVGQADTRKANTLEIIEPIAHSYMDNQSSQDAESLIRRNHADSPKADGVVENVSTAPQDGILVRVDETSNVTAMPK